MAVTPTAAVHEPAWINRIRNARSPARPQLPLIGVLPGEGIGPEVIDASLAVLNRLEAAGGPPVTVESSGPIGKTAERETGAALPGHVLRFCEDVLRRGGAVLSGPGGGRYVYDLRLRLGLFI